MGTVPICSAAAVAESAATVDAVELVDALPHTATGKISKRRLREQFKDYEFANTR